eukprot:CAMPEP_0177628680 /NCGR_PEP_ID=MMETSP0447-20121125/260_1 /TAXON_ID=0 /ORGANISM="Stygamoeba regulata, Strain BSH-02190019" /LENGTH=1437 /DNA_ID=CAMNT_0019129943 /DNA_START=120 /DNA_END=4433 /DNA_ORIENTATION=+
MPLANRDYLERVHACHEEDSTDEDLTWEGRESTDSESSDSDEEEDPTDQEGPEFDQDASNATPKETTGADMAHYDELTEGDENTQYSSSSETHSVASASTSNTSYDGGATPSITTLTRSDPQHASVQPSALRDASASRLGEQVTSSASVPTLLDDVHTRSRGHRHSGSQRDRKTRKHGRKSTSSAPSLSGSTSASPLSQSVGPGWPASSGVSSTSSLSSVSSNQPNASSSSPSSEQRNSETGHRKIKSSNKKEKSKKSSKERRPTSRWGKRRKGSNLQREEQPPQRLQDSTGSSESAQNNVQSYPRSLAKSSSDGSGLSMRNVYTAMRSQTPSVAQQKFPSAVDLLSEAQQSQVLSFPIAFAEYAADDLFPACFFLLDETQNYWERQEEKGECRELARFPLLSIPPLIFEEECRIEEKYKSRKGALRTTAIVVSTAPQHNLERPVVKNGKPLNVRSGDTVFLVEPVSNTQGWFRAESKSGAKGLLHISSVRISALANQPRLPFSTFLPSVSSSSSGLVASDSPTESGASPLGSTASAQPSPQAPSVAFEDLSDQSLACASASAQTQQLAPTTQTSRHRSPSNSWLSSPMRSRKHTTEDRSHQLAPSSAAIPISSTAAHGSEPATTAAVSSLSPGGSKSNNKGSSLFMPVRRRQKKTAASSPAVQKRNDSSRSPRALEVFEFDSDIANLLPVLVSGLAPEAHSSSSLESQSQSQSQSQSPAPPPENTSTTRTSAEERTDGSSSSPPSPPPPSVTVAAFEKPSASQSSRGGSRAVTQSTSGDRIAVLRPGLDSPRSRSRSASITTPPGSPPPPRFREQQAYFRLCHDSGNLLAGDVFRCLARQDAEDYQQKSFRADLPCGRRGKVDGSSLELIARPRSGTAGTIWSEELFYDRDCAGGSSSFVDLRFNNSDGCISGLLKGSPRLIHSTDSSPRAHLSTSLAPSISLPNVVVPRLALNSATSPRNTVNFSDVPASASTPSIPRPQTSRTFRHVYKPRPTHMSLSSDYCGPKMLVRVCKAFKSPARGLLSLQAGEMLWVLSKDPQTAVTLDRPHRYVARHDAWLFGEDAKGSRGYFPRDCVQSFEGVGPLPSPRKSKTKPKKFSYFVRSSFGSVSKSKSAPTSETVTISPMNSRTTSPRVLQQTPRRSPEPSASPTRPRMGRRRSLPMATFQSVVSSGMRNTARGRNSSRQAMVCVKPVMWVEPSDDGLLKQVRKGDYVWNLLNRKCDDPTMFWALSWRGNEAMLPLSHFQEVTSQAELNALPSPHVDSRSSRKERTRIQRLSRTFTSPLTSSRYARAAATSAVNTDEDTDEGVALSPSAMLPVDEEAGTLSEGTDNPVSRSDIDDLYSDSDSENEDEPEKSFSPSGAEEESGLEEGAQVDPDTESNGESDSAASTSPSLSRAENPRAAQLRGTNSNANGKRRSSLSRLSGFLRRKRPEKT